MLRYFRPGIETLAEELEQGVEETITALRTYYYGYLFAPKGSRLYNPYSVLNALKKRKIAPYWFESGTPTFLARRVKRLGTYPPDINGKKCDEESLLAVGLHDHNPVPLMCQTG